jgi:hypothetical protein
MSPGVFRLPAGLRDHDLVGPALRVAVHPRRFLPLAKRGLAFVEHYFGIRGRGPVADLDGIGQDLHRVQGAGLAPAISQP